MAVVVRAWILCAVPGVLCAWTAGVAWLRSVRPDSSSGDEAGGVSPKRDSGFGAIGSVHESMAFAPA